MLITLALALACSTAPAPAPAPAPEPAPTTPEPPPAAAVDEDRCADGRAVFPFWAGEYPSPVLQLDAPAAVQVSDTACGAPSRSCMMPPGLYHPWSKEHAEGTDFRSRTAPTIYIAQGDFEWESGPVTSGTEVTVLTYLSEGMCSMVVGGAEAEGMCPGTSGNPWQEKPRTAPPDDQILKVVCTDGAPGWLLVDEALAANPVFREGEMVGYGEVKKRP
ncbi:MAG: hypothetical protein ACI8S6_001998 [Myxococcota bacterium]|jgi:hypothetical protein